MAYEKEKSDKINIKTYKKDEIVIYEEDDVFSNSTLSDVDNSYIFWKNGIEERDIFELCNQFECSEDECEKNDIKENLNASKSYSNIEINTMPVEINNKFESNLLTEIEK
ncbi:conserved Plasmodium protein, unknown function [Plasmodium gallinaceum]|uniref:Uncharacterized protein n=1 Tax=Plasmodium gallinaceum TaxID=5849 RepID=A0A1J1H2Y7_PLAGA|nr:conserved Plasmodium protein, unknown function [Plasmodium gallinaceum]CRG97702.1 conserved Plasmodium protein, unknown function [Plasmodium gallinaceum]